MISRGATRMTVRNTQIEPDRISPVEQAMRSQHKDRSVDHHSLLADKIWVISTQVHSKVANAWDMRCTGYLRARLPVLCPFTRHSFQDTHAMKLLKCSNV